MHKYIIACHANTYRDLVLNSFYELTNDSAICRAIGGIKIEFFLGAIPNLVSTSVLQHPRHFNVLPRLFTYSCFKISFFLSYHLFGWELENSQKWHKTKSIVYKWNPCLSEWQRRGRVGGPQCANQAQCASTVKQTFHHVPNARRAFIISE